MKVASHDHFKNKSPEEHLRDVQEKHRVCMGEPHSTVKGLCFNLANEAFFFGMFFFLFRTLFFLISLSYSLQIRILLSFGIGWIFFRSAMSAREAWAYMELTHRSIHQEKDEIDTNFEQEKIELAAIYRSHGFKSPLVDDVVEYISSDTSLLLDTMIREELHIELENFPHPLKQCAVRLLGGLCSLILFLPAMLCASFSIAAVLSAGLVIVLSLIKAKILENDAVTEIIWTLSICITFISFVCILFKML